MIQYEKLSDYIEGRKRYLLSTNTDIESISQFERKFSIEFDGLNEEISNPEESTNDYPIKSTKSIGLKIPNIMCKKNQIMDERVLMKHSKTMGLKENTLQNKFEPLCIL